MLFPQQLLALVERETGQPISQGVVLWDHYYRYYRMTVQDALHRSRRKPFQLGGLAGYDQLVGVLSHLEQDNPLHKANPFFSELESRLRQATEATRNQAEDIRQAQSFLGQVEHFLAHTPRPVLAAEQNPPPEVTARYKVGDIATVEVRDQWQFTFRPIRAVHFRNEQFWYLFEEVECGYCESDVVLASEVGRQAEGLLWHGQTASPKRHPQCVPTGSTLTAFSEPHNPLTGASILPQFLIWIGDINSILVEPQPFCWEPTQTSTEQSPGPAQVQKKLEQMFKQLDQQPNLGPICRRLFHKSQKMAQTWLPGILHCYTIPALPRHNLELEAVYGKLRANQRRVSGRKDTSPLRLFGAGEVMALLVDSDTELLAWCQTIAQDKETYRTQRRLQEECEERQRWLWRLHRNPVKAMAQVDEQFYAILKERELLPVIKQTIT